MSSSIFFILTVSRNLHFFVWIHFSVWPHIPSAQRICFHTCSMYLFLISSLNFCLTLKFHCPFSKVLILSFELRINRFLFFYFSTLKMHSYLLNYIVSDVKVSHLIFPCPVLSLFPSNLLQDFHYVCDICVLWYLSCLEFSEFLKYVVFFVSLFFEYLQSLSFQIFFHFCPILSFLLRF